MSKMSENIGVALAQVQDVVDSVIGWGVAKMKSIPQEDDEKESSQKTVPEKVVGVGKQGLRFLGQIGVSYYEEYERLKAKKQKKDLANEA